MEKKCYQEKGPVINLSQIKSKCRIKNQTTLDITKFQ